MIIPPIKADLPGAYLGPDGHPADVGLADPLFQWTVYGRYQSGGECDKARSELRRRSLHLNPADATAVAWSFAKCLEDHNAMLQPDQSAIGHLQIGR